MGKCLDQLRRDYGRGLNDEEITEVFEEAKKLYDGVQAANKGSEANAYAQALAAKQAERELIAAVLKKRNSYMQLSRKIAIIENIKGNWQGREWEGLSALMVGGRKLRDGARLSVDSIRSGLKGQYIGGFLADLEALGKDHFAQFKNGKLDQQIAEAMWSIDNPNAKPFTGSQTAMDIAEIAHKWQEKARLDQNRVGGFIGQEPGYIVRQSHDSAKIGKAGFDEWKKEISDKLDWTRTAEGRFDPAQNPDFTDKEKTDWLFEVFQNLQTGKHLKFSGAQNPMTSAGRVGSLAARVSQERVLHFRDGGALKGNRARLSGMSQVIGEKKGPCGPDVIIIMIKTYLVAQ